MSIERLRASFANPFDSPATAALVGTMLRDVFEPATPLILPPECEVPFGLAGRPADIDVVLSTVRKGVVRHAVHSRHPHALAHMMPPPASISVVADLIIGAMNQCAFIWEEAPMAQVVEREVVDWLRDAMGFNCAGGGLLTSGGTMSNFLATHLALGRWRQQEGGLGRPCILASDQAHLSIDKAAALSGLVPTDVIRVRTNGEGRLPRGGLARAAKDAVRAGRAPVLVVSTGGTTNSGTLEPMDEALEVASAHRAWCHVDAAHGGFVCLAPELLAGTSPAHSWLEADSLAWDAHKGLYASYAVGSLLVRDKSVLDALRFCGDYALKPNARADAGINHFEGSRRFEALKLWMIIEHFGKPGLAELSAYNCGLARKLAERVRADSHFSLLTDPDTNIVCFRFQAPGYSASGLSRLNEAIQEHAFKSGGPLLSTTVVSNRVYLRAVFLNPHTSLPDIEYVVQSIKRIAALLGESTGERPDNESVVSY